MSHDVFICHSSKDRAIANAICAKLEQNRIRCWIAPRDVVPGSEFGQSIMEGLQDCKLTILVFSANSNNSAHVHKEIERSVNHGRPILPFRVEDVVPSPALEYFISDAHWLDAITPPLEQHLDYLVGTVRLLLEREAGAAPRDADANLLPPPGPTGPVTTRRRRRLLWVGLAAVAVLVAAVAGLLVARARGGDATTPRAGTTSSQAPSKAFVDDFTTKVDPSWTWVDGNADGWKITADGWLEIQAQEAPPYRNILLRDAPKGSWSVKVRLRFPKTTPGFAGLVFTGGDLDNRLQFGWTETGLTATEYKDGSVVSSSELRTADLPATQGRDAQVVVEVKDGLYTAKYYDAEHDSYWDMGTQRLDPSYTRVGLLAYSKGGTTATAGFDRIAFY